jgi:hypothetical protein
VGRPGDLREEAIEFVLEFLTSEPMAWESLERAAEARSIASPATLGLVRAELNKEGKIEQIGKGKAAKWVRTSRAHAQRQSA